MKVSRNYAGDGPVSLAGKAYAHSLMLHPEATAAGGRADVTYDLAGGLERAVTFHATIGVDDAMKSRGSVVFVVEIERGGEWARVFESSVLQGGQAQDIAVSIVGARRLRLLTSDGGDDIHCDHAVWAEPLLR
jgi:hypothetical protein